MGDFNISVIIGNMAIKTHMGTLQMKVNSCSQSTEPYVPQLAGIIILATGEHTFAPVDSFCDFEEVVAARAGVLLRVEVLLLLVLNLKP